MANLVCWASGLLQVLPTNDTPAGPVIITSGLAAKLDVFMRTYGVYSGQHDGYYVPGCLNVPTEGREDGAVQHDRLSLVIAFEKRLLSRTKRKELLADPP